MQQRLIHSGNIICKKMTSAKMTISLVIKTLKAIKAQCDDEFGPDMLKALNRPEIFGLLECWLAWSSGN